MYVFEYMWYWVIVLILFIAGLVTSYVSAKRKNLIDATVFVLVFYGFAMLISGWLVLVNGDVETYVAGIEVALNITMFAMGIGVGGWVWGRNYVYQEKKRENDIAPEISLWQVVLYVSIIIGIISVVGITDCIYFGCSYLKWCLLGIGQVGLASLIIGVSVFLITMKK